MRISSLIMQTAAGCMISGDAPDKKMIQGIFQISLGIRHRFSRGRNDSGSPSPRRCQPETGVVAALTPQHLLDLLVPILSRERYGLSPSSPS